MSPTAFKFTVFAAFAFLSIPSAQANDKTFINWCTNASANNLKTCTCANQRIKQSTNPKDVRNFLNNGGKITLDQQSIAIADAITRAIKACKN